MRLKDYYCREMQFTASIPFSTVAWKKVSEAEQLAASKPVHGKERFQVIIAPSEDVSDYHFHFASRVVRERGRKRINLTIGIFANENFKKIKTSRASRNGARLESWLSGLIERFAAARKLNLSCITRFVFPRTNFAPVLPMPFKGAFGMKDRGDFFNDVSISGVKMEVEKSSVGVGTIYYEVFPGEITMAILFGQRANTGTGFFQRLLEDVSKVAEILVEKKEKNNAVIKA